MPTELVRRGFICVDCNKKEFGEKWINKKGRVVTYFWCEKDEKQGYHDLHYSIARHCWLKHNESHWTKDKEGEKFKEIMLSDKYKDREIGNIIE